VRCIERVVEVRGGRAVSPEGGEQWPDGRIVEQSGAKVPVEVVQAFERLPGENPNKGSAWVLAKKLAEKQAAELEAQLRVPVGHGAHGDQPVVVPWDGKHLIPPRLAPARPLDWVMAAVEQKMGKRYGAQKTTILVVHFDSPFTPFTPSEVAALRKRLWALQWPFREVWVVDDYGSRAQRLSP
jgi:hypothetical protein